MSGIEDSFSSDRKSEYKVRKKRSTKRRPKKNSREVRLLSENESFLVDDMDHISIPKKYIGKISEVSMNRPRIEQFLNKYLLKRIHDDEVKKKAKNFIQFLNTVIFLTYNVKPNTQYYIGRLIERLVSLSIIVNEADYLYFINNYMPPLFQIAVNFNCNRFQ